MLGVFVNVSENRYKLNETVFDCTFHLKKIKLILTSFYLKFLRRGYFKFLITNDLGRRGFLVSLSIIAQCRKEQYET